MIKIKSEDGTTLGEIDEKLFWEVMEEVLNLVNFDEIDQLLRDCPTKTIQDIANIVKKVYNYSLNILQNLERVPLNIDTGKTGVSLNIIDNLVIPTLNAADSYIRYNDEILFDLLPLFKDINEYRSAMKVFGIPEYLDGVSGLICMIAFQNLILACAKRLKRENIVISRCEWNYS